MGKLILCEKPLAALPYYIENLSLNIYSAEELCYYIENNVYLLEQDFMDDELTEWIGKELHERKLAEKLLDIRKNNRTLSSFVTCILSEIGYTPPNRIAEIAQILKEMDGKSAFACAKIRADRYLQRGRYLNALSTYQALLASEDAAKEDAALRGSLLHNMGCAYANLFLFVQAAQAFEKAYQVTGTKESLEQCLAAFRFAHDENGFYETANRYGVSAEEQECISGYLTKLSRDEDITAFEKELDDAKQNSQTAKRLELLEQWKQEYRRNCRL